ncbi:MAG: hypothetical protein WCX22_04010 [Methanoregula sp.]
MQDDQLQFVLFAVFIVLLMVSIAGCLGSNSDKSTTQQTSNCFISATLNTQQAHWGDTVEITGTDTCPTNVKFFVVDGRTSTLPSTACIIGNTQPNADKSFVYSWNTGQSQKECNLNSGLHTVFVTTTTGNQYTRMEIIINPVSL